MNKKHFKRIKMGVQRDYSLLKESCQIVREIWKEFSAKHSRGVRLFLGMVIILKWLLILTGATLLLIDLYKELTYEPPSRVDFQSFPKLPQLPELPPF